MTFFFFSPPPLLLLLLFFEGVFSPSSILLPSIWTSLFFFSFSLFPNKDNIEIVVRYWRNAPVFFRTFCLPASQVQSPLHLIFFVPTVFFFLRLFKREKKEHSSLESLSFLRCSVVVVYLFVCSLTLSHSLDVHAATPMP